MPSTISQLILCYLAAGCISALVVARKNSKRYREVCAAGLNGRLRARYIRHPCRARVPIAS